MRSRAAAYTDVNATADLVQQHAGRDVVVVRGRVAEAAATAAAAAAAAAATTVVIATADNATTAAIAAATDTLLFRRPLSPPPPTTTPPPPQHHRPNQTKPADGDRVHNHHQQNHNHNHYHHQHQQPQSREYALLRDFIIIIIIEMLFITYCAINGLFHFYIRSVHYIRAYN